MLVKLLKLFVLINIFQGIIMAAPKSEYDQYWDKFNNNNKTTINHSDFDQFLKKYVKSFNGTNLVDYKGVSKEDRNALNTYIKTMVDLPILSYSKSEQQAYWINLYNALTIQVILDTYPVKSIKESYGGILKTGPWDKKLVTIEGKEVSLNDIEHRILRPLWKDSRVHFLVNCASIGCPNLLLNAITPTTYEAQAQMATKAYINSPRGVQKKGNKLILSSIFDWYRLDFGNNRNNVLKYLSEYYDDAMIANFTGQISYEYDWALNQQ